MNVLMVAACPFPTAGGTQVLIGEMASALARAGTRVELVTYGVGAGDLRAHDAAAPYTIHRAPAVPGHRQLAAGPSWGRPVADAGLAALTARVALSARRRKPFDVVHAHNYEGALAGAIAARAAGLPLLYHAHNLMGDELETYFQTERARTVARWVGMALDRTVPRLSDATVSVSRHAQRRLRSLTGGRRIEYQPPAVRYGARTSTAIPCEVLYTGNLDGYQSLHVLDAALGRLPNVSCTVVSRTPWSGRSRVRWVLDRGFESVKPYLEGARVAVLPRTVPSGFPVKLVNYLCAGTPVVACESGAQGLGPQDGVWTVADGDTLAFADAIDTLLKDSALRERFAVRAAEAALRYSWEAHVAQLEEMYKGVVASAGTRTAAGRKPASHPSWTEGVA
jgi:glycosyltransferase involved in cell wall biosynthesis